MKSSPANSLCCCKNKIAKIIIVVCIRLREKRHVALHANCKVSFCKDNGLTRFHRVWTQPIGTSPHLNVQKYCAYESNKQLHERGMK